MAPAMRYTVYGIIVGLWLSGALWWLLQHYFRSAGEFGQQPHRWQPALLMWHGILGLACVWLLGWITRGHAWRGWFQVRRRISGGGLWVASTLLVVSGFALYYLTGEAVRTGTAVLHEALGLALIIPAVVHWCGAKSRKPSDAPLE
jgi:hypothetical protein